MFKSRRDLTEEERAQFEALDRHQDQVREHRNVKAVAEWHAKRLVQTEDAERAASASREETKKALHEALANA